MSRPNPFITPKGEQKQLRFYIDTSAFLQQFGAKKYLAAISAVQDAVKAVGRLQGVNSKGETQNAIKFFPCAVSSDADIFITIGLLDGVGDMDVHEEDIVGATRFQKHLGTEKPYAQIVMDEAQTWGFGPEPWWKMFVPWLKDNPSLQRWAAHELLHAVGVGHTHPGRFRSIMDEENWMDNDPAIPVYDEAALCLEHGFEHHFIKSL